MSTSRHQGVILYDPSDLDTDEPLDTVLVRDEIIDSALHKADEAAQVRASWVGLAPDPVNNSYVLAHGLPLPYDDDVMLGPGPGDLIGRWWDYAWRGAYDAKVTSDGSGYRLRVMIGGACETLDTDGADFAVVVGPPGLSLGMDLDSPPDTIVVATASGVTSATPDWLTLDSGLTYVDVPEAIVGRAVDRTPPQATLTDIGGDPTTVQTVRLEIMVCGRFKGLANRAVLWGVHVAEYIGT